MHFIWEGKDAMVFNISTEGYNGCIIDGAAYTTAKQKV